MIDVSHISKRYGSTLAVDDVSFTVNRGEIVGFLGPNGAGKSTTMKMLTCYIAPTEGTAAIDGHDILDDPHSARRKIGYLPESTPLYEDMGVIEFLDFMGEIQGVKTGRRARIDDLIDLCGISSMAHKNVGELSKGYRQRVGLAQALLPDPPVLVLDEPTSGLDPAQIVEIRQLIRDIGKEKAILLSTHILPEAQNTCSRILIISRGQLVGEGTPNELLAMAHGAETYTAAFKGGSTSSITEGLSRLPGVTNVELISEDGSPRFGITAENGAIINEYIFDFAVEGGMKLLELNHESTSLEDVFLNLVGGRGGVILSEQHGSGDDEDAGDEETADAAPETDSADGGEDDE